MVDDYKKVCEALVQVSRLAACGKTGDVVHYLQRLAYANRKSDAMVWLDVSKIANSTSLLGDRSYDAIARQDGVFLSPKDSDSQHELLIKEVPPIDLRVNPVYSNDLKASLDLIVAEHAKAQDLLSMGLQPTNKLIFFGLPGVGKTLAARWLANALNLPLYTLDLSAVMSSFLGKTGNNIRSVFEFADKEECILFLDEFDAIAKNRNDDADIGELKRLVNVLLQAIDGFSRKSLLIAATNHSELLDPAVWRRFDQTLRFDLPCVDDVRALAQQLFREDSMSLGEMLDAFVAVEEGMSCSDIRRDVDLIRKQSVVLGTSIKDSLLSWLTLRMKKCDIKTRKTLANELQSRGFSQRDVSKITGLSRDTIRKSVKGAK